MFNERSVTVIEMALKDQLLRVDFLIKLRTGCLITKKKGGIRNMLLLIVNEFEPFLSCI